MMRGLGFARLLLVVGLCAITAVGAAPAGHADGGPSGADLHVAQSLGDRELTVVIRRASPGPLRVDVITHAGSTPGTLTLRATPTGAGAPDDLPPPGTVISEGAVVLGARPGLYDGTLRVDRAGPWELAVDDGERTARIPFLVPARVVTPWEVAAYGGFTAAGVLLIVSLLVAVRARRAWPALVPAGGTVAAIAVAVTGALLSAGAPPPQQPGRLLDPTADTIADPYPERRLSTVDFSRPPVNLVVRPESAGLGVNLNLSLMDSATGRPADDLLVHDNALVHLMIVGPSGRLWHLHPIRTGPGAYQARIASPEPGEYAVAAELSRRGGGVQLVRATVRVGTGTADPAPAPGLGSREIAGTPVTLTATPLITGTPSTITARIGETADLQLWLGMLGHLIIVGPVDDAAPPIWSHGHALAPVNPGGQPDETVAAYGPDITFTYTFTLPGRYRIWVQAERGYTVLTVPATIEVPR